MTSSPPTLAQRIANELRAHITSGAISEGERLPSTRDLAQRYSTTRNTITKAIRHLQAEGLVVGRHGSGVYVRETYPVRRLGPDRYARHRWQNTTVEAHKAETPTSDSTTQQGHQTQDVNLVPADAATAHAFNIAPGTPVYERARTVTREGVATHTMTSYYRTEDVEGTPIVDDRPGIAGRGGSLQILTDQGLPPEEITEELNARMPTTEEALLLDIPWGEPVVEVRRTIRTTNGRAIEYACGVHRAPRFTWSYTYSIPD